MRSLREVKTQIYQTECGKYLKEGLCLSEPILTLGKEGLIDNFFQYAAEEKGMYFGRPNLLFGIYSDQSRMAYLTEETGVEDKVYSSQSEPEGKRIAAVYERYEKAYPVVREHIYRDDYREYEEILKQYYRDLQEVSGETVCGFCTELVPEFFRWYEDCFGKMEE